ncbi:MAG: hypothetical protein ACP5MK_00340 [Candidatus Micrarchaeia archaeon]
MAMIQTFVFFVIVIIAFALIFVIQFLDISYIIKFVLVLIALLMDIVAFSLRFYMYLFFPLLKMKKRKVVLSNEETFMMAPNGNAIMIREGSYVYASTFVKLPIYKSATEMSDDEKRDFSLLFSKLVSVSKTPIKITTQYYIVNRDAYLNNIRDKLNEAENRYQQMINDKNANPKELDRVRGEVTMWSNLQDSVGRAKSTSIINYIMVTAIGGNEEEAVTLAVQRGEEIAAGAGAILGITTALATGEELLLLTQPEQLIPFSTINEEIRQKTLEKGGA